MTLDNYLTYLRFCFITSKMGTLIPTMDGECPEWFLAYDGCSIKLTLPFLSSSCFCGIKFLFCLFHGPFNYIPFWSSVSLSALQKTSIVLDFGTDYIGQVCFNCSDNDNFIDVKKEKSVYPFDVVGIVLLSLWELTNLIYTNLGVGTIIIIFIGQ